MWGKNKTFLYDFAFQIHSLIISFFFKASHTNGMNNTLLTLTQQITCPLYLLVFLGLVATIELGTILFPFFACISSPSALVGSLLGFIYVAIWYAIITKSVIVDEVSHGRVDGRGCMEDVVLITSILPNLNILEILSRWEMACRQMRY